MDKEKFTGRRICIIGYSGHAFVVIETLNAQGFGVTAYCDVQEKPFNPYQLTYIGNETDNTVIKELKDSYLFFVTIGNNSIRKQVYDFLAGKQLKTVVATHPSAIVSGGIKIEAGTLIAGGAIVQAQTQIGKGVICNSGSIIEHECVIGDFAHIGPGAILCGNVHVGNGTLIGAGAVVNPGITIGSNAIIGSGSVVIRNVPDFATVAGNPAREIKVTI